MYVVKQQIERYEPVETLAEGAMGRVELARDHLLDRMVAIKSAKVQGIVDPREAARRRQALLQEARVAELLSHPNIVDVYEVLDEGEDPALVMEYVAGSTLAQLLEASGPLPIETTLSVLTKVAMALDHAHSMGVIHGDIKAANVLFAEDGETIKLTDFGVSKKLPLNSSDSDGQLFGTPRYVAPELLLGQKADARCDLYSLGVLLFEMLTGRSPFHGSTAAEVAQEVVQGSLKLDEAALREVPESLQEVLEHLLARDPGDRYPSADKLLTALGMSTKTRSENDETVTTQDLTELVVPELPDPDPLHQVLPDPNPSSESNPQARKMPLEPEAPTAIDEVVHEPESRKTRIQQASRSPIPWPRYAVLGTATAVVALAIGWALLWMAAPRDSAPRFNTEAHAERLLYVPLLQEGQRLLRAGEPAVAARVLRRAESVAPNVIALTEYRKIAEEEALALEELERVQDEVTRLLEEARRAVDSRQIRRASQLVAAVRALDPENLEARTLLEEAGTTRQAPNPAPREVESAQLAHRPEPTETQAAIEFPATATEPVSAAPRVTDSAATDNAPTGMSSLQVDLFSYLPKGVVTIYSNENQVLLQPFRFGRRQGLAGLIRRKKSAGRLEKTITLPAGTSEFRIYVSADGIETQTVNLMATLRDGESHVLRLIIAENGSASAQLN